MKQTYFLIPLLTIAISSCQTNEQTDNQTQTTSEQIIEQIQNLPDTVLTSRDMRQNEFQADLTQIDIDDVNTSKLNGEWNTESGKIRFLNTTLEPNDKVVFYDTIRSSMTGWGTITFNRAAKFYFTESGSYMYEYYVLNENKLILTQYVYRNDDLSMKETPLSVVQELDILFKNDDSISLGLDGQIVELKRKNTTANNR